MGHVHVCQILDSNLGLQQFVSLVLCVASAHPTSSFQRPSPDARLHYLHYHLIITRFCSLRMKPNFQETGLNSVLLNNVFYDLKNVFTVN